jgi:UDP-glucose 4-epimerase
MRGDNRDPDTVRAAMAEMDAVIHMATLRITACAENPREAFEVMCTGSFNVVEAARDAGVARIVTASFASVYGMAESFPTTEEHHPYGNRTARSRVPLAGSMNRRGDSEVARVASSISVTRRST